MERFLTAKWRSVPRIIAMAITYEIELTQWHNLTAELFNDVTVYIRSSVQMHPFSTHRWITRLDKNAYLVIAYHSTLSVDKAMASVQPYK